MSNVTKNITRGEDGGYEFLSTNQVYAEDEDFPFVLDFIRSHTNCR